MITKDDFLYALAHHPRADDAIFWFCYAWHTGDDDLYRIMCSFDFTPRPWSDKQMIKDASGKMAENPNYDPVLVDLLGRLSSRYLLPSKAPPFEPVLLSVVREGHVLTPDGSFACLRPKWPCRVFKYHGALGVQCSGGLHNVKLLPGSESTFHPLQENAEGYVIGFVR